MNKILKTTKTITLLAKSNTDAEDTVFNNVVTYSVAKKYIHIEYNESNTVCNIIRLPRENYERMTVTDEKVVKI